MFTLYLSACQQCIGEWCCLSKNLTLNYYYCYWLLLFIFFTMPDFFLSLSICMYVWGGFSHCVFIHNNQSEAKAEHSWETLKKKAVSEWVSEWAIDFIWEWRRRWRRNSWEKTVMTTEDNKSPAPTSLPTSSSELPLPPIRFDPLRANASLSMLQLQMHSCPVWTDGSCLFWILLNILWSVCLLFAVLFCLDWCFSILFVASCYVLFLVTAK